MHPRAIARSRLVPVIERIGRPATLQWWRRGRPQGRSLRAIPSLDEAGGWTDVSRASIGTEPGHRTWETAAVRESASGVIRHYYDAS